MWTLLKRTFTILALPTITLIVSYLINAVFNDTVVDILDNAIEWLDYIVWNRISNLILIMVTITIITTFVKFILRLLNGNDKE